MNQSQCKELLPVLTAWAQGKEIQSKDIYGSWSDVSSTTSMTFELPSHCYRIKPEPITRNYNAAEMRALVGKTLAHTSTGYEALVTGYDPVNNWVFVGERFRIPLELRNNWTLDGKPCQVTE